MRRARHHRIMLTVLKPENSWLSEMTFIHHESRTSLHSFCWPVSKRTVATQSLSKPFRNKGTRETPPTLSKALSRQ